MTVKPSGTFARTKILTTLGPASSSADMIRKMITAGIDGVRLNFSHGSYSFFSDLYNQINTACIEEKYALAVLADLQGPKMRIDDLEQNEVELNTGDTIEITTKKVTGNRLRISTSYEFFADDAQPGDPVLIDDGLIRLRVTEKKAGSVICYIENGGILKSRKGMNMPGMKISSPSVTEKDYRDLEFAVQNRADYIALSFVRTPNDITGLREWMKSRKIFKPLIAKIEKKEAVDNFDDILNAADGIMVARGDLGVELPPEQVPVIQKEIIRKCNACGKLVITATQMLESMIHNPTPTRAEASDVANAVWDGTDVVMLSGETAVGKYPVNTILMMNDIVMAAEAHLNPLRQTDFIVPEVIEENLFDSIGRAISDISRRIKASAIVVFTFKGRTARNIAKYRPDARIIAVTDSFDTMNQLNLVRGVTPLFFENPDKQQLAVDRVKQIILETGLASSGDSIIITAGAPYSEKSTANWMRFEVV